MKKLLAFAVAFVLATPAFGWNEKGHMVTARLAWRQLTQVQRAKVSAILKKHPHYEEFLVNHSIILNGELPFAIHRAQQLYLGVALNLSFYANPDPPRRNDYSFYVGYDLALSRSFSIDASARLAVRDYYVGDRTDVSEILSLSANYRIRDWLTLSALSSFAWNESNHSVFAYNVANVGGGIALTLKF